MRGSAVVPLAPANRNPGRPSRSDIGQARKGHVKPSPRLVADNNIIIGVAQTPWSVEFHRDCEAWAESLPQSDKEALLAAMRVLASEGPARPSRQRKERP
jgi:hypothetical protein